MIMDFLKNTANNTLHGRSMEYFIPVSRKKKDVHNQWGCLQHCIGDLTSAKMEKNEQKHNY